MMRKSLPIRILVGVGFLLYALAFYSRPDAGLFAYID